MERESEQIRGVANMQTVSEAGYRTAGTGVRRSGVNRRMAEQQFQLTNKVCNRAGRISLGIIRLEFRSSRGTAVLSQHIGSHSEAINLLRARPNHAPAHSFRVARHSAGAVGSDAPSNELATRLVWIARGTPYTTLTVPP